MKKILLKVFSVILALCCVGLVACQKDDKSNATLVDFVDSTVKVQYGMNYQLTEYVYDTDGNRYTLDAKILDPDNNTVAAEKFFQVEKSHYVVVYTAEFNEKQVSKVVTVIASSKPTLELADSSEKTYTIGILAVELPETFASDMFDGEVTDITKEVYKVTTFGNVKMTDYSGTTNFYTPATIGTYFWKITATNSWGETAVRTLFFYVTEDIGEPNIYVYEGGETRFSVGKTVTAEYVTADEIPQDYTYTKNIKDEDDNIIGTEEVDVTIRNIVQYHDHAYKFSNIPHNSTISVDFGYTADEYLALERQGKFNAVKFSYMIQNYGSSVRNNDQRLPKKENVSWNDSATFLSAAGYYGVKKSKESDAMSVDNRFVKTNEWETLIVPISDFVQTLGTGKTGKVIRTFGSGMNIDFYLSDVEFITWDWENGVIYKGDYNLYPTENLSILSDGMQNSDYETAYLDEEAVEDLTTVNNVVEYDGTAYEWKDVRYNTNIQVKMPYTGEEYAKEEINGKFNAVKVTFALESTDKTSFRQSLRSTGDQNPTLATAIYGKNAYVAANIWLHTIMSVKDFVSAMNGDTLYLIRHLDTAQSNGTSFNFYLGNIEFVTWGENDVLDKGSKLFIAAPGEESDFRTPQNDAFTYVSANDEWGGVTGIENAISYGGDAIHSITVTNNKWIQIKTSALRYTVDELQKLLNNGTYTHIRLAYLAAGSSVGYKSNQGGLFVDAGATLSANTWTYVDIPIQVLIDEIGTSSYASFFRGASDANFVFYAGDIELVKLSSYAFSLESGLSKISFPDNVSYVTKYMTNKQLKDEKLAENYDGNAIKISGIAHNRMFYVYMPLTTAEYEQDIADGKITHIKITYMITMPNGGTPGYLTSTNSLVSVAGNKMQANTWVTETIDLSSFTLKDVLQDKTSGTYKDIMRLRPFAAKHSGYTSDFYLGNIEFVKMETAE